MSKQTNINLPLGINIEDVVHLDELGNRRLVDLGFLDVTAAPFHADPTGKSDSTKAIQDAVFFARHHKLAAYFPMGTYRVSDTITCMGGWSDERTPGHRYLPYVEVWPCVLIGEKSDAGRPRIRLTKESSGFADTAQPKAVIDFDSRHWHREGKSAPLDNRIGATGFNQTFLGLDIEIEPGNPGAAAISFDAAEGSTIQDCTFDMGDGLTGILGGPGSGGATFNVTIRGGRIGALLNCSRPPCTLVGCRFEGQRESGVDYCQRGALTLVGCSFALDGEVPALRTMLKMNWIPSASMVDCRIEYRTRNTTVPVIKAGTALYLRNVWVRNANLLCRSTQQGDVPAPAAADWFHVQELAVTHDYVYPPSDHQRNWPDGLPIHAPIYVNGERREGVLQSVSVGDAPPSDLCSKHILWDERTFPAWNDPQAANVKSAPYGATGDGVTDDTAAIQKAIDTSDIVFLPKGAYRISRTLRLRANTKLIGINAATSMLVPLAVEGGDFGDPANPRPVLQTADTADAATALAFFSVFMPREITPAASFLDWACGGNSCMRSVCPIIGHTINNFAPLAKGIYPWTNWKWEDMEEFCDAGGIAHIDRFGDGPLGTDSHEGGISNWPLARVHGHGGGGWYPFWAIEGGSHGLRRRRILVDGIQGPFALYHSMLQYCTGSAEMEVVNSRKVSVYGSKNEQTRVMLWIRNSHDILLAGRGGVGVNLPEGKIRIEASTNVDLANLHQDFSGWKEHPVVREIMADGSERVTAPHDWPVLYRS